MNIDNISIPFVEKYRPTKYDDIVINAKNNIIFSNILKFGVFPNLFLYGPPGTGKTTTIINLINEYQKQYSNIDKSLIIHLNASDERGIDTIRHHINSFISSMPLFNKGKKFVILDEVDYMTKNAQIALKYLLQRNMNTDICFCLICNYISKIDIGLQNEFIKIRFNELPEDKIMIFLKKIVINEKLNLDDTYLKYLQCLYKSDIRSMINTIQNNCHNNSNVNYILNDDVWENMYNVLKNKSPKQGIICLQDISRQYNVAENNLITYFLNYIISKKRHILNSKLLKYMEYFVHSKDYCNSVSYDLCSHHLFFKIKPFLSNES